MKIETIKLHSCDFDFAFTTLRIDNKQVKEQDLLLVRNSETCIPT